MENGKRYDGWSVVSDRTTSLDVSSVRDTAFLQVDVGSSTKPSRHLSVLRSRPRFPLIKEAAGIWSSGFALYMLLTVLCLTQEM